MMWAILVILLLLWLLGFFGQIGGGMIHILLLMAVAILVFNLMSRRRAV
jgi:hypothetical protein